MAIKAADGFAIAFKACPTDDRCEELVAILDAHMQQPSWSTQRILIRKIVELCAVEFPVDKLTLNDIDVLGKQLPEIIKIVYGPLDEKLLNPPGSVVENVGNLP